MPAGIGWQDVEWLMPIEDDGFWPEHGPFSTPLFGGELPK
jgi:hypothetical protein